MAMNKKGLFYTITSIILVVVILLAFSVFEASRAVDKNSAILGRVKATNNFVQSVDRDLDRAVRIASLRATLAFEEKIVADGSFLSDASAAYEQAIMNGTVNGVSSDFMANSTFPDWVARIQSEASRTGAVVSISVQGIDVFQDDPWHVKCRVNVSVNITDMMNTSSWYQQKEVISAMNVVGLEDPLYAVKTYGRAPNVINITPYDGNYTSGANVANLKIHAENSYYVNSTSAPSFLMRFEGNLSASPYGIESMVNQARLAGQGIATKQKAVIDYLYWGSNATTDYRVTGMPADFYIDSGNVARYQVSGLTY